MKVLLVEDDRPFAQEIAAALRHENFAVDIAVNGEDGQHLGETENYDAAVLDLGLPKINGAAVLRAWRRCRLTITETTLPRVPSVIFFLAKENFVLKRCE